MVPSSPGVQIELGVQTCPVHTYSHACAHTNHTWPTKEDTPGKSGNDLGTPGSGISSWCRAPLACVRQGPF